MNTKILLELLTSGTRCGDIRFCFDKNDVLLEIEYRKEGCDWIDGIQFDWTTAFRFRDEYRSLGFADGSYNNLVEILNSEWIAELKRIEPKGKMGLENARHFAVFLDSNGYFEVIAKAFTLKPAIAGLLD